VRPDEAEKVKSKVRESGTYKVIDKVTVKLNEKRDVYEALLSNLGVKNAEISDTYVRQFEKLLVGGIWCIVTLKYHFEEEPEGLALHGDGTQADPDAQHGHGGAVRGAQGVHR
jgi:ATP-dependent Lon protease